MASLSPKYYIASKQDVFIMRFSLIQNQPQLFFDKVQKLPYILAGVS